MVNIALRRLMHAGGVDTLKLESMDTVVDVSIMMQSWGHAKVYIMQKNTDPRLPDRSSAAGLVIEGEEKDKQ